MSADTRHLTAASSSPSASDGATPVSVSPLLAAIGGFISALYRGARQGLLAISIGPPMKTEFFSIADEADLAGAARFAFTSAHRHNVYFGVGLRREGLTSGRGDSKSVIGVPAFWIDIDIQHAAHKEQNLPPDVDSALALTAAYKLKPTVIVQSGHGLHAYWVLKDLLEVNDLNRDEVQARLRALQAIVIEAARQKGWKLDNTSDLSRILRIPGTMNHKDPDAIVPVTFEVVGPRYSLDEIDGALAAASQGSFAGFAGFVGGGTSGDCRAAGSSAGFAGSDGKRGSEILGQGAFPPANFEAIRQGCGWIQLCIDDAERLPEPDWYGFVSVVGRCENGEALAHQYSKPYPGYTPEETTRKLEHALAAAGPITCQSVMLKLGREGICSKCPSLGKVASPITLGLTVIVDSMPWPKAQLLSAALPPVVAFEYRLLPPILHRYVQDLSERMQVPPDYPAALLLLALSGVIGRRAMIRPKANDLTWVVVPNLWGGIIGRPGVMKSPVMRTVLRPLMRLQAVAMEEYKSLLAEYEVELDAWTERKQRASKKGDNFDEPKPEKPRCLRYVANDATIEKLHEILEENPQGILETRDELAGWLATLDTKGRERERPFFLEGWNGDGSHTIDRIGRGTHHVENVCISILGGIQPGRLEAYMLDAVKGGANDDGLIQRFQVLVYPDPPTMWEDVDRPEDGAAAAAVESIFNRIAGMSVIDPLLAKFTPEAQELMKAWRSNLENRFRRENMPAAIQAHLTKYRKLMPATALILHLAEWDGSDRVPLIQAQRAAAWCDYLESHALRIYSCGSSLSQRLAAQLGAKIKAGDLGTRFTVRQAYTKGWANLDDREPVRLALGVLEDAGWVRPVASEKKPGRPSEEYLVNPEVYHE